MMSMSTQGRPCSHFRGGCRGLILILITFSIFNSVAYSKPAKKDDPGEFGAKSLFKSSEPILQLDAKNFSANIYNQPRAFAVEFYSSWCGACINFAPKWTNFSRHVQSWNNSFQTASVNCALDENTDLCREHSIEAYPSVKYFKWQSKTAADSKPVSRHDVSFHERSPAALYLAGMMAQDWKLHKPDTWPKFESIERSQLVQDLPGTPSTKLEVVIVDTGDNVSHALQLDYDKEAGVKVVPVPPDHPWLSADAGWDKGCRLGVYDVRDFTKPLWSSEQTDAAKLREEALVEIKILLNDGQEMEETKESAANINHKQLPNAVELEATSLKANTIWDLDPQTTSKLPLANAYEVQMDDLLSGLSYMFKHEIPMKQSIHDVQYTSLTQFIDVLATYFPGAPPMQRLLFQLNVWLRDLPNKATSGAEFATKIGELESEFGHPLSHNQTWVACRGSEPKYRGYPCSLWTLFHVLTVHAYDKHSDDVTFKPQSVLKPIAAYIEHFFGCSDCRENFAKKAVKMDEQIRSRGDVVLWLWRAHNAANQRLLDSPSSDPAFRKLQFPPRSLCPECRSENNVKDSDSLFDDNSHTWDLDVVLKYLTKFYKNVQFSAGQMPYKVSSFSGNNGRKDRFDRNLDLNPQFRQLGGDFSRDEEQRSRLARAQQDEWEKRYDANHNKSDYNSMFGLFNFSKADWSICVSLWLVSAVLLGVFCFYVHFRRNRSKYWKKVYYLSDYKV